MRPPYTPDAGAQRPPLAFASIRARMLAWFGSAAVALIAAFGFVTYAGIRDAVVPLARELSAEILDAHSAELGRVLAGYRAEVSALAASDLVRAGTLDEIGRALARRAASSSPDFRRLAFADPQGEYVTSEGYRGNAQARAHWVQWQALQAQGRDSGITDALVSASSGEPVFVVAAAVIDRQGQRVGTVSANVSLATLSAKADAIRFGESGSAWVADSQARLIAHPDPALRMRLSLLEGEAAGFDGLEAIGRRILRGEGGQADFVDPKGRAMTAFWRAIPGAPGWMLGVVIGRDEIFGHPQQLLARLAWHAAAAIAIALLAVAALSRRISAPIAGLREGVDQVTAGDLGRRVDVRGRDEIRALAEAFNRMTEALSGHVEQAARVAAEREHAATELELARRIQASSLPAPIATPGMDLSGVVVPAREVAGDFYDWLPLPGGRVALLVGDVSGKGVSAALFAARAAQLLRSAVAILSPAEAVAHVNAALAASNPDLMFVTLFLGVWDPAGRVLQWVNAGHNPPLLLRAGGWIERLDRRGGPALGPMTGQNYTAAETRLEDGDLLAVYTDGITEAPGPDGEPFGEPWLTTLLRRRRGGPLPVIAREVVEAVDAWQGADQRFDDVTLVLARVAGMQRVLDLPAEAASIAPVVEAARACALSARLEAQAAEGLALAACEAATNVIVHALADDPARRFRVFLGAIRGRAVIRFEDEGPPFDPDRIPKPDLRAPLSLRPVGGLGWVLIRRHCDAVLSARVAGTNVLTLARQARQADVEQSTPAAPEARMPVNRSTGDVPRS